MKRIKMTYQPLIPVLLGLLLLLCSSGKANVLDGHNGSLPSQESRLVKDLMTLYKTQNPHNTRPVLDSNTVLNVQFGMGMVQVLNFNEKDQMLSSLIWKQYYWYDQYLTWNPDDYGGVKLVRVAAKEIWTPDIVLFNNAGDSKVETHDKTKTIIKHDGGVTWIPAVKYDSSCPVNMEEYPFDEQICYFRFGSWTETSKMVDMKHIYTNKVDLNNYVPNSGWKITQNYATDRQFINYTCCEDPFAEIIYELHLKRTMSLHMRLILVPTLLLSIMSCAIFWIPPNRPDRTTLGLGLFSSFFLLLISILNNSPPVPHSQLGLYYTILILMVAFGLLYSVLIINVFNWDSDLPKKVDGFVQWFDRCSCNSKRPRGRAAKKTPSGDKSKQMEEAAKATSPGPGIMPNRAKWQRFAWLVDRIVFFLTAVVVVISYICVFPHPMFIFDP